MTLFSLRGPRPGGAARPAGRVPARLSAPRLVAATAVPLLALACLWGGVPAPAQAASLRYCDRPADLSAAEKDRLLRFAALVKSALQASGAEAALVSRSGLDLDRFDIRYSHAGIALPTGLDTPWAVRQLYFDCDERRPRVFDQGLAGFVMGLENPRSGYLSVVLLPPGAGGALARAVLDRPRALDLLGPRYSANAYAFGLRYQNCNQWVAEIMASAWGDVAPGVPPREAAQGWLLQAGYLPTTVRAGALAPLAVFVPWLHVDDHPPDDLARNQFRVSMPAALEDFIRQTVPGAQRLELCHAGRQAVLHRGWEPVADGCRPGPGDEVVALD